MDSPIFFHPIPVERVWGGRRFEALPRKKLPPSVPVGELWEIVDRAEAQSTVAGGALDGMPLHDLWSTRRAEIFGHAYIPHPSTRFPLLVKLLDASEKLSVQVHPPRHRAAELGGEPKTEVWYFLESAPGASVYAGLKKGTTRAQFESLLASGGVESALHEIPVHTGESLFIPSGRLHAIGGGNLIVEIQQNSDTTYRAFDWNRHGLDGKPRTLHIPESMASIDFADFEPSAQPASEPLVADCPLFRVEKIRLSAPMDIRPRGRFAIAVPLDSPVVCGGIEIPRGRFFLIPASSANPAVSPSGATAELLATTLPA